MAGFWNIPPQVIVMETSGEPHQQDVESKAENPAGMWESVMWVAARRGWAAPRRHSKLAGVTDLRL